MDNLIKNSLSKIRDTATNLFKPVQQAVSQVQQLPQQIQATGQLMGQGLQERGNQISEGIASIPYNHATSQRNDRIQNGIQIGGPPTQFQQIDNRNYRNANQYGKLAMDSITGEGAWQPTAEPSAVRTPLFIDRTSVSPSNPYLEGLKKQVLSNPGFRPSAREYLSKIPIIYEDTPIGVEAQAHNSPELQNPYIGVSPDSVNHGPSDITNENYVKSVIEHELLHQTPQLVPQSLFHPKNQPIIDQYTERWGADYAKQPGALVGEMFAQEDLPPAYYWHIFKNVNPQASQQDFLGYLNSWFTNELTNQVQGQPQQGIVAHQGSFSPNPEGGPVQQ